MKTVTYRFKFNKSEEVKFTGHLDIMQTFQRGFKRAKLPIAYSEGFNPHQKMAFAAPLSLGYISRGEYGDFKLTQKVDPETMMKEINSVMPKGLEITKIVCLRENTKNPMASFAAARYKAIFDNIVTPDEIEDNIAFFMEQAEILVMKKTKKNFKEVDIKPDIIKIYNESDNNIAAIGMLVAAGSVRNLKPENVAEGFCNYIGKKYDRYSVQFEREDMLMLQDDKLVPLNFGVEDI